MSVDIVYVSGDLCLNVLRSVGISQSVLGLVEMCARWTDTYDHDGLAIPTQGEFEKSCELGVPVRYVILLPGIAERIDTAA